MLFFLTEIVYDFCNVIMMIWVILINLTLQNALFYIAKLLLMIRKDTTPRFARSEPKLAHHQNHHPLKLSLLYLLLAFCLVMEIWLWLGVVQLYEYRSFEL